MQPLDPSLTPSESQSNAFPDWNAGKDYKLVKQVGSGSYGFVMLAIQQSTGKKVAIKKILDLFEDPIDAKRILREITLLRKMQNDHIIQVVEISRPKLAIFNELYIIMDYYHSDLKKLLKSPLNLDPIHITHILYNILCGVKYLHSAKILHRDLKPANILLNEDCSIKICDFGLARSVYGIVDMPFTENMQDSVPEERPECSRKMNVINRKRQLTSHVVTRWYRAPELILLEKNYDAAIDMWSVGCIAAELQGYFNILNSFYNTILYR